MHTITIEQVEALAQDAERDVAAERAKLLRLIRAEARIVAAREPERYEGQPIEIADEDGHYDTSYPPAIVERDFAGPQVLRVRNYEYDEVATEGGFYHAWRCASQRLGLYVAPDGALWGAHAEGTGRVGQFAAHPGNCGVTIDLDWQQLDDVSLAQLREVEEYLRQLAFPRATALA